MSRIVTERLRILIHISNYYQTLEIMGKTLSEKNEPKNDPKSSSSYFTHLEKKIREIRKIENLHQTYICRKYGKKLSDKNEEY